MKLLQEIQGNFAIVGVVLPRTSNSSVFNGRILILLTYLGLYSITTISFLFFDAETFQEYTLSFFACTTVLINYVGILTFTTKITDMFRLIEHLERIVANRKTLKYFKTKSNFNKTIDLNRLFVIRNT